MSRTGRHTLFKLIREMKGTMYECMLESICLIVLVSASISDLRSREVHDAHWIILGILTVASSLTMRGSVVMAVMDATMLAYMFTDRYGILAVSASMSAIAWFQGDWAAVTAFAMCSFVLVLYHVGLIRGGADAKALMCIAMLFPVSGPGVEGCIANPALGVLMIALPLTLVGCLWVLIRNLANHDVHRRMLTAYHMPSSDVDGSFVWELDRVDDVSLVTPMVPFIIPLTVAFVISMHVGNPMLALI